MAETKEKSQLDIKNIDGRILRSRQYKRPFENKKPAKRLFTPEIKRYLKSWLIRRRENPYPSRKEKLELAAQTGLTYIQICNWFANWRRKLKNSGKNETKFTWSTLIKSYNDQAYGNVEHLSISSNDSIWEEPELSLSPTSTSPDLNHSVDHCYSTFPTLELINFRKSILSDHQKKIQTFKPDSFPQCFQISSTTDVLLKPQKLLKKKEKINFCKKSSNKPKYNKYQGNRKKSARDKNRNYKKIIEEFNANSSHQKCSNDCQIQGDPFLLSKWRKSIALFQHGFKPYSKSSSTKRSKNLQFYQENFHARDELDAAEALTFLSRTTINAI